MSGDSQNPLNRLAILADFTPDFLVKEVKKAARDSVPQMEVLGFRPESWEAQTMNPESDLYKFNPGIVLIACSGPAQWSAHISGKDPSKSGNTLLEKCTRIWDSLKANLPDVEIWQTNLGPFPDGLAGTEAPRIPHSFSCQRAWFNHEVIVEMDRRNFVFLLDWNSRIQLVGTRSAYDPRLWQTAAHSFALPFLEDLTRPIMNRLAWRRGRFIKVLVLDLDETLWGGVVGDLGPQGIQIGQEGMGNIFRQFQLWARHLLQQGILLAVASHNMDSVARSAFSNPEMILQLEDFAAFRASWAPKSTMIREMSEELNIGLDAFCFLDNSAFERNEVRNALPDVRVPELPDDPSQWLEYLSAAALFEPETISEANQLRTRWIQDTERREKELKKASSYEDYLKSLDMRGRFTPLTTEHLPRAHQLIMRTNQFNLRTIRHSMAKLEEMLHSDQWLCYFCGLEDCHGDYGWISLLLLERNNPNPESAFLDTWIMSCRVFERGMEFWIFNQLVSALRDLGLNSLTAEYIPTPKNGKFAGFLGELGFLPSGSSRCCLDLAAARVHETHIKQS